MPSTPPPSTTPSPAELVPRRIRDAEAIWADNPFAGASFLMDKNVARLYNAIDDQKTVAEICRMIRMDMKDAFAALRTLLEQQRIQIYDVKGKPVEAKRIFPSS